MSKKADYRPRSIWRKAFGCGAYLCGARDYVGRRGGDLMIDIDPANEDIKQILRRQ